MKEALQSENAVLIAGGYGVVGSQIARFVRKRHPDLPLIIGGRNPDKAESLAREFSIILYAGRGNFENIKQNGFLAHS